jgi:hypothetical protein
MRQRESKPRCYDRGRRQKGPKQRDKKEELNCQAMSEEQALHRSARSNRGVHNRLSFGERGGATKGSYADHDIEDTRLRQACEAAAAAAVAAAPVAPVATGAACKSRSCQKHL